MIFWRWLSCFKCMQNSTKKKSIENASSDSLITMQSIWFQGPRFSTELNWTELAHIWFVFMKKMQLSFWLLTAASANGQQHEKSKHISITKFVLIVLSLESVCFFPDQFSRIPDSYCERSFQWWPTFIFTFVRPLHFHTILHLQKKSNENKWFYQLISKNTLFNFVWISK